MTACVIMSYIENLATGLDINKIFKKSSILDRVKLTLLLSDKNLTIYFEYDYQNIFDKLYEDMNFMNVPTEWLLKYVNFLLTKRSENSRYNMFSKMLEDILYFHGSECQWQNYDEIIVLLLHNKIRVDSVLLSNQYFLREYESYMHDCIIID